jgi:transcriptional regulator with XRE-family HTH domain
MTTENFSQWLEKKYIEWISESGRRRTLAEFSDFLRIPRPLLSRYLNGSRVPKYSNADQIAAHLGPEVYTVLGYRSPDEMLLSLQSHWNLLNDRERAQIEKIVDRLERK